MALEALTSTKVFGGIHGQYTHPSSSTACSMRFAIFLPPQVSTQKENQQKVPVLYWLSGLTCTDENFMQKAGAFRKAAELGIAIVAPDTSPRGEGVADDPDQKYDFGLGAGFYINATEPPYKQHYQMYRYVTEELPRYIEEHFPVSQQRAISGHSMGGHGAIMIGLRNPSRYSSISAFSPITHPTACPWGQKAFTGYLGKDETQWQQYDSCHLMQEAKSGPPLLVDQGDADGFLEEQLRPQDLQQAASKNNYPLTLRMQPGYDHSYFFISSFIEEHIAFHAKHFDTQD